MAKSVDVYWARDFAECDVAPENVFAGGVLRTSLFADQGYQAVS